MEIYLVRHTRPLVNEGVCYGQTDVPLDMETFPAETAALLSKLPGKIGALYSSPLSRCYILSAYLQKTLYTNHTIIKSDLLKEMHFGDWENKYWDDLEQSVLHRWMNNFVEERTPSGESFQDLHRRTGQFLRQISGSGISALVAVTHAGVIRSITTHLLQTELKDAFSIRCAYGSVTRFTI